MKNFERKLFLVYSGDKSVKKYPMRAQKLFKARVKVFERDAERRHLSAKVKNEKEKTIPA
jgi:hypothetical protein